MNGIEAAYVGRLGQDPELRTSKAGAPWLRLSVAVGQDDELTWVSTAVFGERAKELVGQLVRGDRVYCEGRLTLRTWEKDGEKQAGLNVAAWRVERLGEIGKNKPAKPRSAPEGDHPIAPTAKGGFDKQLDDDAIPF